LLMAEKQLTFKENEIIQILNKVYLSFKEGRFAEAVSLLEQALSIDFEYADVANALKCANFWLERLEKLEEINGGYERGVYLLHQWKVFNAFVSSFENISERCLFTLKHYVFGLALMNFGSLYNENDLNDPEILLAMGRCHKARGNFEDAIRFMELASQQRREDGAILCELADCYSLVNENRAAKLFFREAFFLDPRSIELYYLESPMIQRLISKLKSQGLTEEELPDWIPVYGTVYGLFNVKRELRPLELGKLKQSIYQLEKELLQEHSEQLVPRIINQYFWLIDHYVSSGEDREKIEEILRKIESIDPNIYKEYIN
jgi:tetratricopeptide (TPR) repeat protein